MVLQQLCRPSSNTGTSSNVLQLLNQQRRQHNCSSGFAGKFCDVLIQLLPHQAPPVSDADAEPNSKRVTAAGNFCILASQSTFVGDSFFVKGRVPFSIHNPLSIDLTVDERHRCDECLLAVLDFAYDQPVQIDTDDVHFEHMFGLATMLGLTDLLLALENVCPFEEDADLVEDEEADADANVEHDDGDDHENVVYVPVDVPSTILLEPGEIYEPENLASQDDTNIEMQAELALRDDTNKVLNFETELALQDVTNIVLNFEETNDLDLQDDTNMVLNFEETTELDLQDDTNIVLNFDETSELASQENTNIVLHFDETTDKMQSRAGAFQYRVAREITTKAKKMQTCPGCQFKCLRTADMLDHMHKCKSTNSHCILCDQLFGSVQEFRDHLAEHTSVPKKPFFCHFCDMRFAARAPLDLHTPKHSTEAKHKCPDCNKSFKWRHGLRNHRITHGPPAQLLCDECGFSTRHLKTLRDHQLQHLGGTYRCTVDGCSYASGRKETLRTHLATHRNEKPFVCEVCGQRFSQNKNLKRHALMHVSRTRRKMHRCPHCEFVNYRSDKMKEHIARLHTERPLQLELSEDVRSTLLEEEVVFAGDATTDVVGLSLAASGIVCSLLQDDDFGGLDVLTFADSPSDVGMMLGDGVVIGCSSGGSSLNGVGSAVQTKAKQRTKKMVKHHQQPRKYVRIAPKPA